MLLAKNKKLNQIYFRDVDEIVLSYVVSILQDLTSGSYMDEEAFDVDAFCETLFAYMPSTEVIPPIEITVRTLYTIMNFFLKISSHLFFGLLVKTEMPIG